VRGCGGLALQAKPPKRNGARVGGFAHMRTGATSQSRLSTTRRPRFAKSESIAPSSSWLAFWIRWNASPTVIVGGSLAAGAQKGLLPARNLAGVAIQQQDFTCRAHPLMRGLRSERTSSPSLGRSHAPGAANVTKITASRFANIGRGRGACDMWLPCNNPLKKINDTFATLSVWGSYVRLRLLTGDEPCARLYWLSRRF
jgi:hypothetical protein